MKEMQEFEKVDKVRGERLLASMNSGNLSQQWANWVAASDYDALLVYTKELTERIKLLENLVAGGHQ